MNELIELLESRIETISLVPSDGGKFEVSVNGRLLYSKLKTGRHASEGEVAGLVRNMPDG